MFYKIIASLTARDFVITVRTYYCSQRMTEGGLGKKPSIVATTKKCLPRIPNNSRQPYVDLTL